MEPRRPALAVVSAVHAMWGAASRTARGARSPNMAHTAPPFRPTQSASRCGARRCGTFGLRPNVGYRYMLGEMPQQDVEEVASHATVRPGRRLLCWHGSGTLVNLQHRKRPRQSGRLQSRPNIFSRFGGPGMFR